jgi:hypothetical protein
MPPMMLIAAMMMLFLLGQGFGLLGGILPARVFNYVAIATWLVVSLVASLAVTIDGVNNIRRLGFAGIFRPRWWFEISRLTWMFLLLAALSTTAIHFVGTPWLCTVGDFLFRAIPAVYIAFMVFSTGGYLVSGITRRRRRGRAFECMQYFYWLFGVISAVVFLVVWLPARTGWAQPMTVVTCVIAASIIGILVLTVARRLDRKTTDPDDVRL